ncbi:MAG: exodeoxyribonuclease VII small subunit [Candidatus Kapabacteria bacterium]|nr:exodeoxyribonuclease VII small subunit [Candidatus Kapabacteria bacterium]
MPAKKTEAQPRLEDQLKRLEEIAMALDRGDAPIDEQLRLFEEGMTLVAGCRAYLDEAELKVRKLSGEPDVDANA